MSYAVIEQQDTRQSPSRPVESLYKVNWVQFTDSTMSWNQRAARSGTFTVQEILELLDSLRTRPAGLEEPSIGPSDGH